MNIELLQQLCEASAVSGDEQEVRDILINTLEPCVNEITFDGLGSFVARKGNKGPKVAVVGHMDEVGFMVTHIDESVFLRFTTIGGWWNQSMLNHRVTIRTHKGFKIPRRSRCVGSSPTPGTMGNIRIIKAISSVVKPPSGGFFVPATCRYTLLNF